jgi:hypothetical protein
MHETHPDSKIVDDLGGPVAVGGLCQVSPQAVSQWRKTGIPNARRQYLQLLRPAVFASQTTPARPAQENRHAA